MVKKLEKIGQVEKETNELLNYNIKCMKDLQKLKVKSGLSESPVFKGRNIRKVGVYSSQLQKRSDIKRSMPS